MKSRNVDQKKISKLFIKGIIQKFVNSFKKIKDFLAKYILPYLFTILCVILLIVADILILTYPQSITISDFTPIFNLINQSLHV